MLSEILIKLKEGQQARQAWEKKAAEPRHWAEAKNGVTRDELRLRYLFEIYEQTFLYSHV
jgi:hypothetical protein